MFACGNRARSFSKVLEGLLLAFVAVAPALAQDPSLTSFTFSPMAINTTTSSATVTVTAQATDALSGVSSVDMQFNSPGDQVASCGMSLVSGNNLNGTYQCTITFPEYSVPGTWTVYDVFVYDNAGNYQGYTASSLQALGFPTQLIVDYTSSVGLTSSNNPSSYEGPVTFTATVTSGSGTTPTGTVNFNDGSTTIGSGALNASGVAAFTTSSLSLGSQTIVAAYLGDPNNPAADSSPLFQTVNQAATVTTVTSSQNPSRVGYPVTFAASVSFAYGTPPNGDAVEFFDGPRKLGSAKLSNGTASFTTSGLAAGIHKIVANYRGDTNLQASLSAPFDQGVKP
jgi:hypothetical protein